MKIPRKDSRSFLSSLFPFRRDGVQKSAVQKRRLQKFFSAVSKIPGLVTRSILRALSSFFEFHGKTLQRAVNSTLAGNTKKLTWKQLINPVNWFTWIGKFLIDYLTSRPYLSLGPAVFSLIIVAGATFFYFQQRYLLGPIQRTQTYQRVLNTALLSKNYKQALIACRTLIDLQPNDYGRQLQRAQIETELGNSQLADTLLIRLASDKKFGPAAILLADKQGKIEDIKNWPPERHQLFRGLMTIALQSDDIASKNLAKFRLVAYLSKLGADREALNYLMDLVPDNPQLALLACELANQSGDLTRLQTNIPIAKAYHRKQLDSAPDSVDDRVKLARVMQLDGETEEAIQLLGDGIAINKDDRVINELANAYVFHSNKLATTSSRPETLLQRVQLLHQAVSIAPRNPTVVEAVISFAIQCKDNKNEEVVTLREATVQGIDPQSVHFVRGTIALLDNKIDEAMAHLELASQDNEQLPGILNNLAFAISSQKNGDLEKALSLANASASLLNHPYIYETRGQILFKLGRLKEATIDLEKGLQAPELALAILPKLIEAHLEMGNQTLAAEYEARLELLKAQGSKETNQ